MFAVIAAGGHQYRVSEGDTITLTRLPGQVGEKIKFDQVLMVGQSDAVQVGAPFLSGAAVEATIKEHKRDKKILVFKYKRRKNHKKTRGHRQHLTIVEVGKISSK